MDLRLAVVAGVAALVLLAPPVCRAQSTDPADLAQGKILVAPRDSPDPHFAKSVILLARYSAGGVLGLMLQYKSDLSLQEVPELKGPGRRNDPVFIGGPVALPTVMMLLRSKTPLPGALPVTRGLSLLTANAGIFHALQDEPASRLRVFVGYAGWAPGQLAGEVRRHGWYIFDYDESLVFDPHPETLWDRMIAKTGGRLALLR
jgi:putative transcriptional regulator